MSILLRSLKAYQVYGANTDVGKTIFSTLLCRALARQTPRQRIWYLKPVSTGPLSEADYGHIARFAPDTKARSLLQFDQPVSPHIAAASHRLASDASILEKVQTQISECSLDGSGTLLLETAGGVHSPTPAGSSQADLYRPLHLPVLLVADHRLGGISSSISAFESLHLRGYGLDSVLLFESPRYKNHEYLGDYFSKRDISVLWLPEPPPRESSEEKDFENLSDYYEKTSKLDRMEEFINGLSEKHEARIQKLESMSSRAHEKIWYPFTQHQGLSSKDIITIDSAHGDFFQTYVTPKSLEDNQNLLKSTLDGSASWWTQGLGHGNAELSLSAAYAAGRYGHVMFAGAINEPAMALAELMLKNMQNPRLQKVFYSDNGSTGMEVAAKMALTASSSRYKYDVATADVGVLGLKGSYHGDTIGAMDCSEPSTFNGKVHWYQGRGYWFDFPQVKLKNGTWCVEPPAGSEEQFGPTIKFSSLDEVFDMRSRDGSPAAAKYQAHILETLRKLVDEGKKFGALIMEPVILGAGGMLLVDPLFQRCLIQVVRGNPHIFNPSDATTSTNLNSSSSADTLTWSGLPVVFDEVFTGLYRLGRFNAASFLDVQPDISVHAKLLTGGLLPLCLTLASNSIYEAFLGSEKSDALLHGHSYTAHAVGCEVARTSVQTMLNKEKNRDWEVFKQDWISKNDPDTSSIPKSKKSLWSMWSPDFLNQISRSKEVESVIALGSVLAINLHDTESGYNSNVARGLQGALNQNLYQDFGIHSRVLGNVFYLMMGQNTKVDVVRVVERMLLSALL